jgi:hypothetical protein
VYILSSLPSMTRAFSNHLTQLLVWESVIEKSVYFYS